MSTRPLQILRRFPAHLEAARPDKQLWSVVEGLASDLDVLSADLAGVRRAHRLKDADTLRDLILLAGFHGLDRHLPDILFARAATVRRLAKNLVAAVTAGSLNPAARDAAAAQLFQLWATPLAPAAALALYGADLNKAGAAVAAAAKESVSTRKLLDAAKARLGKVCEIHSRGNGTLRALLIAAANALDLEVDLEANARVLEAVAEHPNDVLDRSRTDGFLHHDNRFLHLTYARDRLQPAPRQIPATASTPAREEPLPYQSELLVLEENPVDRAVRQGAEGAGKVGPVVNQQLFNVPRRGFANERLRIEIKGMNGRTKNLQFVHRDEGKAICFSGTVPDGKTLVIDEDGKLTLDGADVTDLGYSWRGGCFGDAANPNPRDWRFDGPGVSPHLSTATFAVSTPPGAMDPGAVFPHPPVSWGGLGIAIGLNRFAFFVAPAGGGVSDASQQVADITLSWLERQPFLFKVWIPTRFKVVDADNEPQAREPAIPQSLQDALERFRPMGVQAQAAYAEGQDYPDALVKLLLTPAPH